MRHIAKSMPLFWFSAITLCAVVLLALGGLLGGVWIFAAWAFVSVFAFLIDQLVTIAAPSMRDGQEFPSGNILSVTLGLLHFPLLALAIYVVSGAAGFGTVATLAAFLGFGLFFGQVSNSNAHELIHRSARPLFTLGKLIFTSHLYGHHASAHPRVHHRHVATPDDPNSAALGTSFYQFLWQAWIGAFCAGFQAETAMLARHNPPLPIWRHAYGLYILGALACLVLVYMWLSIAGVLAYIAIAFYAQLQMIVVDYVQHYGLRRAKLEHGKYEPVGPTHSWNSPHWFTSHMMLNAPRHSHHHADPLVPYPQLTLPDNAPMLPYALPLMGAIALVPRRWFSLMDKRAQRVSQNDR